MSVEMLLFYSKRFIINRYILRMSEVFLMLAHKPKPLLSHRTVWFRISVLWGFRSETTVVFTCTDEPVALAMHTVESL